MATVIEICNEALIGIGEDTIVALTDDNKPARLLTRLYERSRDQLLRAHPWNFATARVALAQNTGTPVYEYSLAYQLPQDCLRVLDIDASLDYIEPDYAVEGDQLLCDYTAVSIKYIKRITDPNIMSADFRTLLSAFLSKKLAIPLTDSRTRYNDAKDNYDEELMRVRHTDAIETPSPKSKVTTWEVSRL